MATTDPASQKPKIPTGQELYDQLMAHIEPELTTEGAKKLSEIYQNETPEQLAARKKRYALAFERYEQAYQGYIQTLQAQVQRYRGSVYKQAEMEDREEEEGLLAKLQQAFLPKAA